MNIPPRLTEQRQRPVGDRPCKVCGLALPEHTGACCAICGDSVEHHDRIRPNETAPIVYGPTSGTTLTDAVTSVDWGRYAAAVARWERLTRPAPAPTDDRGRLNAELPEWMMGFDAGWITDVLDRPPALRAAGNAVCRQQAAVAIDDLLATMAQHRAEESAA